MISAVHDALVLAGGAGRRLGGASKPEVLIGGVSLLDRVLEATARARRVVVVGPSRLARPGVPTVMEEPPGGGPVAGIDAGLRFLEARVPSAVGGRGDDDVPVLVLACDVPRAGAAVPGLLAALEASPDVDGVRLVDAGGHGQLVAVYRRRPLVAALASLRASGGVHGVSVRRLHERLRTSDHPDPHGHGRDADTWEDVAYLERLISRGEDVSEQDGRSPAGRGQQPGGPQQQPGVGSELHRWVVATGAELGVDPDGVDVDLLLDLSRDVAHGVARPAVPLTSFLVGYAVARDGGDRAALERVVSRAASLAAAWHQHRSDDEHRPDDQHRPDDEHRPDGQHRPDDGTEDAPATEERTP